MLFIVYNYMKPKTVNRTPMQKRCLAAIKKGQNPIAKRIMGKLRKPDSI